MSVLTSFDVCGVDPHVGVGAFQLSVTETLDLLVELLAYSETRLLEMPVIPRAFTSSSTLRVETPWT